MVGVLSNATGRSVDCDLVVEDKVRAVDVETVARRERESSVKKGIVKKQSMKEIIKKKARKVMEWEAEEVSGYESVDSFE